MQQQTPTEPIQPRDVSAVLRQLRPAASPAQLRAFACLCARRVRPLMDEELYPLIDLAERMAKGEASQAAARRARSFAARVRREIQDGPASRWHAAGAALRALQRVPSGWDDASAAVREAARESGCSWEAASAAWAAECAAQGELLMSVIAPRPAA